MADLKTLDEIIRKACAYNLRDRYPDVGELKKDLERLSGDPHTAEVFYKDGKVIIEPSELQDLIDYAVKEELKKSKEELDSNKKVSRKRTTKPEKRRMQKTKLTKQEQVDEYWRTGFGLYVDERFSEAVKYLKKLAELDPNNADACRYLTTCYYRLRDWDKMEQFGDMAKRLDRSYDPPYMVAAIELKDEGDLEGAIRFYKKELQTNQGDSYHSRTVHRDLGDLLIEVRQYDEAIDHYRETDRLGGITMNAWVKLGDACADRCKYDKAIQCYEQAVKQQVTSWYELGERRKESHLSLATSCFYRALVYEADKSQRLREDEYLYLLGLRFSELVEYKLAAHCFEKALNLWSGDSTYQRHLEDARRSEIMLPPPRIGWDDPLVPDR